MLFETAYAFSSAKISTLSLLHYKTLVSFNADNAASLNNLGINCEVLGMKFKSNSYLKNAFEKNSNIAGGNLANKYIGGGFYDEAKLILDKAKLADELEPRVGSAIALLSNEMKEEDEKENKFLDIARRQQRFFRTFASMAFSRRKSKLEFSGKWKDKKGVEIDISQDDTFIEAKWVARNQDKKYRIYGTFKNTLFADIKYEEPVYITSLETYEGYAYTNAGCDRLTILILKKDNDILELEFTKV